MALSGGVIAAIVICSLLGPFLMLGLILLLSRWYQRRITAGSDNPKQLQGKTVVITGASAGIGKETALDLAKRGAKVICCSRNQNKAEEAIKYIKQESGNENIQFLLLDLASFASVRKCAQTLLETEDKIDYLINNAGLVATELILTEDGNETTFQANHLGPFLFTELVLPLIKKSAASGFHPRIVIVSSDGHKFSPMQFDDLNFEKGFSSMMGIPKPYCQSKLANILHGKELAKKLENTGISVYSLHPGMIITDIGRDMEKTNPCLNGIFKPMLQFSCKTPFHGAQTTLYCCLEDKIEHESGYYYTSCAKVDPSRDAQNEEDAKKLWDISETLVGLKENV